MTKKIWNITSEKNLGTLRTSDVVCAKTNDKILEKHKTYSKFYCHGAIYNVQSNLKSMTHLNPKDLLSFRSVYQTPDTQFITQTRFSFGPSGYSFYNPSGSDKKRPFNSRMIQENVQSQNHGYGHFAGATHNHFKQQLQELKETFLA